MKPRPTSLYVPKSTATQSKASASQTDVTASVPMQPSASPVRPANNRLRTAELHLTQTDEARDAFATGKFSDPKVKKANILDLGSPLHTEAHHRLLYSLREECARLHNYSKHVVNRLTESSHNLQSTQHALQDTRDKLSTIKEHNRRLLTANQALVADLKTATDSLAEVDAMFMSVSKKRMSRLTEAAQVHPQDMALQVDAPERPLSPTPNRAHGRSAVSLDVDG